MQKLTKMWQKIPAGGFLKSSFVVLIGTMSVNVGSYLYHLVVGRILGPDAYGELAALMALFYLLNVGGDVLRTVLVKFFSVYKASNNFEEAHGLFSISTKILLVGISIGFIITCICASYISGFLRISSPITILWVYLAFAISFLGIVSGSVLQAFQKFVPAMVVANIGVFARLALGIISAFFGVTATIFSNLIANIIGYFAYFFPLSFVLKTKKISPKLTLKDTSAYALPSFFTLLTMTALFTQDVILVKHFFPSDLAGIYSGLSILGKVIFFASSSLGVVLFPTIIERFELNKPYIHLINVSLLIVGGLSVVLTLVYAIFPTVVIDMLLGSSFKQAASYLGIFGLYISCYTLTNLLVTILLAVGKLKVWVFTSSVAILQFVLIWFWHDSLFEIIKINTLLTGILTVLLLGYLYKDAYEKFSA